MAFAELAGRRTAKSKTEYDPATGQYRATLTVHDQHYHDGTAWQPVVEAFDADTAGLGFQRKSDRARFVSRVADSGAYRIYPRRERPDQYVDISDVLVFRQNQWRSVPAATPNLLNGSRLEWTRAGGAVTIACETTWRRLKWTFVLNSAYASQLRWTYTLAGGLTLDAATGRLDDGATEVGRLDQPAAWDATYAGGTAGVVPVTQAIAPADATTGTITYTADLTGAVYPVTVDPTFTDGPGGTANSAYDTLVRYWDGFYSDTNYATATELYRSVPDTGGALQGTGEGLSLLKFDLSSLSGATVSTATLTCTISSGTMQDVDGLYARRILAANSGWTETGATWNYANTATSTRWAGDTDNNGGTNAGCFVSGTDVSGTRMGAAGSGGTTHTAGYALNLSLGLTEFAAMVANNYGLRITDGSWGDWRFASSDHATSTYRPLLTVVYTAGGAAPPPYAALLGPRTMPQRRYR